MCGKFTQMLTWGELVTLAGLLGSTAGPGETVTPMRFASVIRRGRDGNREMARMRWGFVPAKAKDPLEGARFIHARAEGIEEKPTFADAFFHRRALLPVNTFNEGREVSPSRTEQHTVTLTGRTVTAIAVIWERWSDRNGPSLDTFAMVTVPANPVIGTITDRMPALIADEHWPQWLGEEPATLDELKAMLKPSELDMTMAPEQRSKPAPPRDERQGTLF